MAKEFSARLAAAAKLNVMVAVVAAKMKMARLVGFVMGRVKFVAKSAVALV